MNLSVTRRAHHIVAPSGELLHAVTSGVRPTPVLQSTPLPSQIFGREQPLCDEFAASSSNLQARGRLDFCRMDTTESEGAPP